MGFAFQVFSRVFQVLPDRLRSARSGVPALFPCAHMVSDEKEEHVRHLYDFKNVRQFTEDLDHMARHFRPIDIPEIMECMRQGRELPRNRFLYSFDDGFSQMHSVVAPILKRKGLPAVFFLNPEFLDNKRLFYRCKISLIIDQLKDRPTTSTSYVASLLGLPDGTATDILCKTLWRMDQGQEPLLDRIAEALGISFQDYLSKHKPFLSSDQVKDLVNDGFSIGGHSMDHPDYESISLKTQVAQTIDSVNFLVERFDIPYRIFAFPFSDRKVNNRFFEETGASRPGIDLYFGLQYPFTEPDKPMVHRFNAENPKLPVAVHLRQLEAQRSYLKLRHKIEMKRPENKV